MTRESVVDRIYLSAPDVGRAEREALLRAFDSGWIAPVGAELDAFEQELCAYAGASACVALSSGTAALHLALLAAGVRPGDEVVVQSATFAASAFAVVHAGAKPVFCDSEWDSWCIDPSVLENYLKERASLGALPSAVMPVDLYGSTANYRVIIEMCDAFGVAVIRDAAEALGSIGATGPIGSHSVPTAVSFNGNKIMTTSSGGALFGTEDVVEHARYLSTQARLPVVHYEHADIGYNYRLSNLLAAIGRAQLHSIESKVARRLHIRECYAGAFPEFEWCKAAHTPRPNGWLAVALLDASVDPSSVCAALESKGIEARRAWKPMHQQPIFSSHRYLEGEGVSSQLFRRGICLPSGSALTDSQVQYVIDVLGEVLDRNGY